MIMKTVAITGGIGSGKSVVSRLLRVEGYPVYDCDSQAKRIMDNDAEIQRQLQNAFGEDVVVDGAYIGRNWRAWCLAIRKICEN